MSAPEYKKKIYLLPGNNIVCREPAEVITVLGSCVSVILLDEARGIVGVSHYLLPFPLEESPPSPRYATHALPALYEETLNAGAERGAIQALVFGGANAVGGTDMKQNVGELNIRAAFEYLEKSRIPVKESHVAGVGARRIRVDSEKMLVEYSFDGRSRSFPLQGERRQRAK